MLAPMIIGHVFTQSSIFRGGVALSATKKQAFKKTRKALKTLDLVNKRLETFHKVAYQRSYAMGFMIFCNLINGDTRWKSGHNRPIN